MTREQAIYQYAVIVLLHKKEITNLINRLNLGSLTYDSPISEVNKIVIENLDNQEFLVGVTAITQGEGYLYDGGISAGVIILASLLTVGTVAYVADASRRNRLERDAIQREDRRTMYLTQERLEEIAYYERELLQQDFLAAQADFLQREENEIQRKREEDRKSIVIIVVGGILLVGGLAYVMDKR